MIQYPKQVHVTLPSVESWGTNMNILRDPPKAIWTRQRNKVSDTQEITRMIGEDSGDRICEMIKVYPRGINPMVSVSYSNYGTNGGQNRQTTNAGKFGNNKTCTDGRSAYIGQAKLPIPLIDDGSWRPPILRQEDLLPLSRLPRTNTSAYSQPGFISFAKSVQCPPAEKIRQIQDHLNISVRPTATLNVQTPIIEPFEIRQVIDNPIHTSITSGTGTRDSSHHINSDINGRIFLDRFKGEVRTNQQALYSSKVPVLLDYDPQEFVHDKRYTDVKTNLGKLIPHLLENNTSGQQLSIKDAIKYPVSAGFDRPNAAPMYYEERQLNKTIPAHEVMTNKSSTEQRYIHGETRQLANKIPLTSIPSSVGHYGMGCDQYKDFTRNKKIKRTLSLRDGFQGKATIPRITREVNQQFRSGNNKNGVLKRIALNESQRFGSRGLKVV